MQERIARLKIGPGMEPGIDMGPIYTKEHRASVIRWIDRGEAEGAELVVDGRPFVHPEHPDGFFLGVTLFDHVTPDMEIYNEEIFGPVLGIVRAATYDEAIGLINGHKYANGTAIFTTDGGAARRFKLEVDVPMIGVNVPDPGPGRLPLLRRGQGVARSAISPCAARTDPLLHPAEDGHRALAGARSPRRPQPGLPRQQLISPAVEPATVILGPRRAPLLRKALESRPRCRRAKGDVAMIKRVARAEAEIVPLPGRVWHSYFGPHNSAARNVSMGVSVFPPGSSRTGTSIRPRRRRSTAPRGRGRIVTPDGIAEIEPGVSSMSRREPTTPPSPTGPSRSSSCASSPRRSCPARTRRAAVVTSGRVAAVPTPADIDAPAARTPGASGSRSSGAVYVAKAGHLGGPLSAADMLAALYFHVLRIRPDEPGWPDRDRFVLSKGHSSIGLYAAMALRGYFPVEELATFDAAHSRLQGHPDMTRLPGPRHVHRLARDGHLGRPWGWPSGPASRAATSAPS